MRLECRPKIANLFISFNSIKKKSFGDEFQRMFGALTISIVHNTNLVVSDICRRSTDIEDCMLFQEFVIAVVNNADIL